MSLLVFYYCICTFLCRFPNFNPSLSFVAISAALYMSLFQGHVAFQNFTLTCRASFAGCVLFISVTNSLKYIKLLFDDVSLPRSELFSQAMASAEVVALHHAR